VVGLEPTRRFQPLTSRKIFHFPNKMTPLTRMDVMRYRYANLF